MSLSAIVMWLVGLSVVGGVLVETMYRLVYRSERMANKTTTQPSSEVPVPGLVELKTDFDEYLRTMRER